jgi:hypothetical protein
VNGHNLTRVPHPVTVAFGGDQRTGLIVILSYTCIITTNQANCYQHMSHTNMITTHSRQVALCDYPRPSIQAQLHLRNLLVYILHELNDEIDEFMFKHRFSVEVGD